MFNVKISIVRFKTQKPTIREYFYQQNRKNEFRFVSNIINRVVNGDKLYVIFFLNQQRRFVIKGV